jgi:hypothetical protein
MEDTLEKVCPSGHPWGITTDPLPSQFVAVVGGSSAGKTCFMTMAVESLVHAPHGRKGLKVSLESEYDAAEHRTRAAMLAEGKKLPPTQRGIPDALVARFDEVQKHSSRLYLYDAAGEEYTGMERESAQELVFFHDLTGLILLVDPLSLPKLADQGRAADGAQWEACQVSQVPLRVIVSSLSRNVRKFLQCGRSGRRDIPVAVVVNKADFPIVSARIGAEAIGRASEASSPAAGDGVEHRLCRQALMEWGAENEVVSLESDFPRIRYFSCSSLGRAPDESGRPFVADRVLPPLFWLLDEK